MCDLISNQLDSGLSRRFVLGAALAGGVTLGLGSATTAQGQARTPGASASRARTEVRLLGTAGGPTWWAGTGRRGPSSAVVVGDQYYLVDAGEGVGHALRDARMEDLTTHDYDSLAALRGVFLTHLHSDHVVDLNNVLTVGLYNGLHLLDEPVQVWGPGDRGALPPLFGSAPAPAVVAPDEPTPGTVAMVDHLIRAFATDYNDRARDNRRPVPDRAFRASDVPIPKQHLADPNGNPHPRMAPVTFYEDDRVRVSATLVQHKPIFPALAYRFDTDDGSVVFSGDTGPSDNLVELARGADILVHEVIAQEWVETFLPEPRNDAQQGLFEHLLESHTEIAQVGPIAERAGVDTLVLNHLVPGNWPEHKWRAAGHGFSGKLAVGRDLDRFPLSPEHRANTGS